MAKIKSIAFIIIGVVICYLILTVTMPIVSDFANESANTVALNENVQAGMLPGAEEGPRMVPLVLWFLPGIIGTVALVIVLKRQPEA